MTTAPKKKPKAAEPEGRGPDTFGIGMLEDGTLNVVTPAQYAERVAERNAEETIFNEDGTDE